ncbi:hypothetical protein [Allocoleopsis sp.]
MSFITYRSNATPLQLKQKKHFPNTEKEAIALFFRTDIYCDRTIPTLVLY